MKRNISYINSGNFFSKSIFLKNSKDKITKLFIVETNKILENYEKILNFLDVDFRTINNYEILNDLQRAKAICGQGIYLTSLEILENIEHNKNQLKYFSIELKKGENYDFNQLTKKLVDLGYKFSDYKNPGTFSKNGDIFNIFSTDSKQKYEISFWGEKLEDIRVNGQKVDNLNIGKNQIIAINTENKHNLDNFLDIIDKDPSSPLIIGNNSLFFTILDNLNFSKYYDILNKNIKNISCFDYIANKKLQIIDLETNVPKIENTGDFKKHLEKNKDTIIYTKNTRVIENFVEYNNLKNIKIIESKLNILKSFQDKKQLIICDDILSKVFTRKRLKKNLSTDLDLLLKIKPGDYVVHIEHGIGIFKDIIKKELPNLKGNIIKEYIEIEYAGKDKLFVPITEVSRVNKYLGIDNPKLTGLGGMIWEKKLQKAKQEAEEIAQELIEIYANRKMQKGFSFISDSTKENIFKNSFSYTHTDDQSITINEILDDMSKSTPMDRLVVGDVGFGKTEIAFNSIYRSYINKKQSILIVPLVVLAYEHYEKAKERFKSFGLKIGILTRLETEKKASETIRKLSSGELDLVIGTHKLLSDKIIYKDLGLIVTDEEHKFGVTDKEKIKEFKTTIDSLAMSATPIPRSLNMALSNLRQISILKTPPFGRQDIDTIINRFSESIIQGAGEIEFNRNGQMFFVHNRVSSIENIKTVLKNIFPEKKIIITHGQLPGNELEKRIIDFKNKKYDILLSTTVIENGIDFSNVNTIIINNAEQFGLSQIHQLRGRVGRSDKKGYCHLLYKQENIKPETAKRLKTVVEHSYVGAGFELAMKDLEIRGGGDLLGFRQSGQSSSIGINLYLKIIEEKILELQEKNSLLISPKNKKANTNLLKNKIETKIDIDIPVFIPDNFFSSELDKINFYREIELISDLEELNEIKKDFYSNNSEIDESTNNLFNLLELKLLSSKYLITNIKKIGINFQIDFHKDIKIEELKKFLDLDKQVKFKVINATKLRSEVKNFTNNKIFIEYILSLLKKKNLNFKIKLKG